MTRKKKIEQSKRKFKDGDIIFDLDWMVRAVVRQTNDGFYHTGTPFKMVCTNVTRWIKMPEGSTI